MQSLRKCPARPRRKRQRPAYPRAIGAGLLVAAAACGDGGGKYGTVQGGLVPPFQQCPSEAPEPNEWCNGWTECSYEVDHLCPDGEWDVIEKKFSCDGNKVIKTAQSEPNCTPIVSSGVIAEPFDCPSEEPTVGEACDGYWAVCYYDKLVRCPDGQPETVVVEYGCSAYAWEMLWESTPECS